MYSSFNIDVKSNYHMTGMILSDIYIYTHLVQTKEIK